MFSTFAVVCFCSVFIAIAANKSFSRTPIIPHAHLPPCGESYNTSMGFISHKPFQQVSSNERCSFTISVKGAADYKIALLYLGFPTNEPWSNQTLVLTGARIGSPPVMTCYRPQTIGSFVVTDSNIVIVTFFSSRDYNNGSGCALQYEAIFGSLRLPMSVHSTHHVLSPVTFRFTYWIRGDENGLGFSPFVFLPDNNTYTGSVNRIWYKKCSDMWLPDTLFVYSLNINSEENIWQLVGRIDETIKNIYIPTDEVTLIVHFKNASMFSSAFMFSFIPS